MKLEFLDEEILRLTALLKDYPTDSFYNDGVTELVDCGYLRRARNGLTYRLTEKGYGIIGSVKKDKYPVGRGKTLERRIECAKVVLTMYRAGIDVFDSSSMPRFVPAFTLRRFADRTLGALQLIGLLILPQDTFLVYYMGKDLKIDMEIRAAERMASVVKATGSFSVMIMGDSYEAIKQKVPPFPFDIYAVTVDEVGADELKSICGGSEVENDD